jgi:hypothetical protein
MNVNIITEGFDDGPHAMVMCCFLFLYRECVEWDSDNILVERVTSSLEGLLEKGGPEPYFKDASRNEGFAYCIDGDWEMIPRYNPTECDFVDNDPNGNYVESFQKHSKYIACFYDDDYFLYWSENINKPASFWLKWYTFPAVAYSFEEIQAWFVWSIKRIMPIFPHQHAELTALMRKFVDVDSAITLLLKKLDGEIPWAFGPARMREPKMLLWHHLIHDKKMNDWIRQWLV